MPKFLIAYHGGDKPTSEIEGKAHMDKWNSWIKGLGDNIINPGTPLMNTKVVTASTVEDENSKNPIKGYAIIKAENFDSALAVVKTDPFLETNGTIRLSQIMEMG